MQAMASPPVKNFITPAPICRWLRSWRSKHVESARGRTCSLSSKRRSHCSQRRPMIPPSSSNPRLAGMHWTGDEYLHFLNALQNGSLLTETSMNQLLADHTASATIAYSPTVSGLGEDWHYGFGLWLNHHRHRPCRRHPWR